MLVTLDRSSLLINTGRNTENIEVIIRFLELKRTKRNEPPIVRIDSMKDNSVPEPTHTRGVIHCRYRMLVNGNERR